MSGHGPDYPTVYSTSDLKSGVDGRTDPLHTSLVGLVGMCLHDPFLEAHDRRNFLLYLFVCLSIFGSYDHSVSRTELLQSPSLSLTFRSPVTVRRSETSEEIMTLRSLKVPVSVISYYQFSGLEFRDETGNPSRHT